MEGIILFRFKFVFSDHARKRCIQRNIDTSLLRRQLLSFPYDEDNHKHTRWDIPGTNLFVVFMHSNFHRVIVTVRFRNIREGEVLHSTDDSHSFEE
jgi:hypothetical protein